MLLLIVVKKSIKSCVSDIKVTAAGAGIMGLMVHLQSQSLHVHQPCLIADSQGNKGGTAIRMKLTPPSTPKAPNPCPTILTFVNSHLAAFDEMVDKRNADFHDLGRRLTFDSGTTYNALDTQGTANLGPSPLSVYETDVLIWMVCVFAVCGARVLNS